MRVLLVTGTPAEGAYLHKALRECAHSVRVIDNLRDGAYLASQEVFEAIIIVAVNATAPTALTDDAPASLLKSLALFSDASASPAMMVVVPRATSAERAALLRAGADACFVQPYSFTELQERMVALDRRRVQARETVSSPFAYPAGGAQGAEGSHVASASSSPGMYQPDATVIAGAPIALESGKSTLTLDAATHELAERGKRIPVTKGEYLLMECLLRAPNRPVSREQLIHYAWPDKDDVEPASVSLVVSRLRRKLADCQFTARIETVSRFGYRLCTHDAA